MSTDGLGVALLIGMVLLIFAVVGVSGIANDSRPFYSIVKDCKEYGAIQNEHTRMSCTVIEGKL